MGLQISDSGALGKYQFVMYNAGDCSILFKIWHIKYHPINPVLCNPPLKFGLSAYNFVRKVKQLAKSFSFVGGSSRKSPKTELPLPLIAAYSAPIL